MSDVAQPSVSAPTVDWQACLAVVLMLFGIGIAYAPTLQWVGTQWAANGIVGHGYLIAVISFWLLWRERDALSSVARLPVLWIIPVTLALSLVWLIGYVANIVALQSVVIPIIALAALLQAFGWQVARVAAFPLLYLYCGLPALRMLQPIFQEITTLAVGVILKLVDIPAELDGNFVFIPLGNFEIAQGCAGVSYLLAGIAVALLYSYLFLNTLRRQLLLTGVTVLATMIGNWIRVVLIIAIGHYAGMEHPWVADHQFLGWIIFAVMLVPVLVFARSLEPDEVPERNVSSVKRQRTPWIAALAALAVLSVGPVWAAWVTRTAMPADAVTIQLPTSTAGWRGPMRSQTLWTPRFADPDVALVRDYRRANDTISVYANVYLSQSQDRELIYYANDIAGDWPRIVRKRNEPVIDTAQGPFREVQVMAGATRALIWYRYELRDHVVTDDRKAKIDQAFAVLSGYPIAGVLALQTFCDADCDDARKKLDLFTQATRLEALEWVVTDSNKDLLR
ncbi:MAG: exosortase C-terminal domain/associated protein EpsI [Pseudomonadota bacterium]